MRTLIFCTLMALSITIANAREYKVGDEAINFSLKDVNGQMAGPEQYNDAKGFVVIFTCNHCPYSKAYEDRIIEIDKAYKAKGYPVLAINPNDAKLVPEDSYDNMKKRAKEKSFTFPYLHDSNQEVANTYGAARTPQVYILKKENNKLIVKYIGAIDNNYQNALAVTEKYVTNALDDLLAGNEPKLNFTKAIGCTIKRKK